MSPHPAASTEPLHSGEWPDLVRTIEGCEALRFLRAARGTLSALAGWRHFPSAPNLRRGQFAFVVRPSPLKLMRQLASTEQSNETASSFYKMSIEVRPPSLYS